MAHVRTQIRNAVAAQLAGLASTGARVFVNRLRLLQASELPALIIRTDDESISPDGIHYPALQDRRIALTIEGVAAATSALDDTLDQIALEVEQAMSASAAAVELNGLAHSSRLESIAIDLDAEAERPTGRVLLRYEINTFTTENAPDVAI